MILEKWVPDLYGSGVNLDCLGVPKWANLILGLFFSWIEACRFHQSCSESLELSGNGDFGLRFVR